MPKPYFVLDDAETLQHLLDEGNYTRQEQEQMRWLFSRYKGNTLMERIYLRPLDEYFAQLRYIEDLIERNTARNGAESTASLQARIDQRFAQLYGQIDTLFTRMYNATVREPVPAAGDVPQGAGVVRLAVSH